MIVATGVILLCFSPLLRQAMELVTRVFYSRSDLDLILTPPLAPRKIFSVRIGSIAVEVALFACCWRRRSSTCWQFSVASAVSPLMAWRRPWAVGTAFAVAINMALFRTIGAKRTRLMAQIVAAVFGAAFVIGLQIAAIPTAACCFRRSFRRRWLRPRAGPDPVPRRRGRN